MKRNTLKLIEDMYRQHVGSPKQQAILAALIGGGLAAGLYPMAKGTLQSLGGPLRNIMGGGTDGQQYYDPQYEQKKDTRRAMLFATLGAAGLGGASLLHSYSNPQRVIAGMDKWNTSKTASINNAITQYGGVINQFGGFDPRTPVNIPRAAGIIRNDPFLSRNDPYSRHMGTAIINGSGNGRYSTLGSVYDSAVDKFDAKYRLQGVGSAAMKAGLSYAGASLFTKAVGGMLGLPSDIQRGIINAGTWAGTLSSILN